MPSFQYVLPVLWTKPRELWWCIMSSAPTTVIYCCGPSHMPLNLTCFEILAPAVNVTIALTDSPHDGVCDGFLVVKHAHLSCLSTLNAFEKCVLGVADSRRHLFQGVWIQANESNTVGFMLAYKNWEIVGLSELKSFFVVTGLEFGGTNNSGCEDDSVGIVLATLAWGTEFHLQCSGEKASYNGIRL